MISRWLYYSIPWAKIMTRPGSRIISSEIWVLSQAITTTACLPGILLHTYCSYCLRFICLVSRVCSPGGHLLSWAFSINSFTIWPGHPDSCNDRLIIAWNIFSNLFYFNFFFNLTWSTASGVDIIPPQRVTRARGSVPAHLMTSSSSRSLGPIPRTPPLPSLMARTRSFRHCNSRFCSVRAYLNQQLIINCQTRYNVLPHVCHVLLDFANSFSLVSHQ